MKKKGFTLVELLGVLVVLAIMLIVTVPAITSSLKSADQKKYESFVQNITESAELYVESNLELFPELGNVGGTAVITVGDLVDNGFLKADLVNPKTDQVVDLKEGILVTVQEDRTKQYQYPYDIQYVLNNLLSYVCSTDRSTECFEKEGNSYYYKGASGVNDEAVNWLWYGKHLWRITGFNEADLTMTLISSYPVAALYFYSSSEVVASYTESDVARWLQDVFVPSLPDYVRENMEAHPMTYTASTTANTSGETKTANIRILTKNEYSGANSYLDIKDSFWLADIATSPNVYTVNSVGSVASISSAYGIGVRPVVQISDLILQEGNGSGNDPYLVSEPIAKTTDELEVGSYIQVPAVNGSYLTRVVGNDHNGVKVVLNGLSGSIAFGSTYNLTSTSTILTDETNGLYAFRNTLNSDYFDSNMRTWYIGTVPSGDDYELVKETTFSSNIGLLTLGDLFSGNDIDISNSTTKTFVDVDKILNPTENTNYWLMNSYQYNSGLWTYRIESAGFLGNTSPSSVHGVRPSWYLKDNLVITGGNGSANNPYQLN